jgi:hypothetical protein
MPNSSNTAEHILNKFKGLRAQMQAGEEPVMALPGIWDGGQSAHSTACDIIVTNQRVIGYYYRGFPREHIFCDALNLIDLHNITRRQKSYEPVFRELLLSTNQRKVYIRMPRQKSEELYEVLRMVTTHSGNTTTTHTTEVEKEADSTKQTAQAPTPLQQVSAGSKQAMVTTPEPTYDREEVQRPFDTSPLAIVLLLIGGSILEIVSIILWAAYGASIGLPLFIAGFLAVIGSFLARARSRSAQR